MLKERFRAVRENFNKMAFGSLIFCAGWTLASFHALKGNLWGVYIYILAMFAGFKIARDGDNGIKTLDSEDIRKLKKGGTIIIDTVLLGTGFVIFSYGYLTQFEAILNSSLLMSLKSALYLMIGYGVAHYGFTNVPW
ncbi:MAG: hypothetical protein ABEJ56_04145 [Candidatus Nanohaloarchaea archaeon]